MNGHSQFPKRHAISRAELFLDLVRTCPLSNRDLHEACLEAAIVFCRTAIHRLETRYEKRPGWKTWFNSLRRDSSVEFIQNERNVIVHEAPPKVGQVLHVGQQVDLAKWCYYYDSPVIPAIDTVRGHVRELQK